MTTFERVPDEQKISLVTSTGEGPMLGFFQQVDDLRKAHPYYWSTFADGFWVLTQMDQIREVLQKPQIFSNKTAGPTARDPDFLWIPEMLDPPEHTKWRQLMAPFFAPGRMTQLEDKVRSRAVEIIETFASSGSCDVKKDFAERYPTTIFMELMGLPVEDSDLFMEWTDAILNTPAEADPDRALATQAMMAVNDYFTDLIAARRREPRDDLVSQSLTWEIDGKAVSEPDLLSMCQLMFIAGLDTVTCQLAWSFYHLATHPEDRRRVVEDPAVIPSAVEELLRVYTIVRPVRKLTTDIDFHGCPMKQNDIVWLPLSGACRDPEVFTDADRVDLDRVTNPHIAFGAGPHRCVGSHLARRELRIALEEWHKRIPDYRIADGAELKEWGGAQMGIVSLPLVWDVRA